MCVCPSFLARPDIHRVSQLTQSHLDRKKKRNGVPVLAINRAGKSKSTHARARATAKWRNSIRRLPIGSPTKSKRAKIDAAAIDRVVSQCHSITNGVCVDWPVSLLLLLLLLSACRQWASHRIGRSGRARKRKQDAKKNKKKQPTNEKKNGPTLAGVVRVQGLPGRISRWRWPAFFSRSRLGYRAKVARLPSQSGAAAEPKTWTKKKPNKTKPDAARAATCFP